MSLHGAIGAGCHSTITCPDATSIGTSEYTVAALYKPNDFGNGTVWRGYQPNDFSFRGMYVDGDIWCPNEQADTNIPSFASPGLWYWLVVSKGSSEEAPRAHYAPYVNSGALSWTHMDAGSGQTNRSDINRICLGDEFGTEFRGSIACLAAYTSELSDAAIEAVFIRSSRDIVLSTPKFFVHWPFAQGSEASNDLVGGGASTIHSGAWDAVADPSGFDFTLTRSGKAKVWDGGAWVQHIVKSYNGASWSPHPLKGRDGSGWITAK